MLDTYRRLLGAPHVAATIASALVSRLPVGFEGFAIVLLVREATGSYAAAGVTAAAFAAFAGIATPILGRLIDRIGQTRVLVPTALLGGLLLCGLALAGALDAPLAALIALAAGAGATLPPVSACVRAIWPRALPAQVTVESAYALESVLQELIFIAGPLLAAGLIAVGSPSLAVLAAGVLSLVGTLVFAASPLSRGWRPERVERRRGGALASPGIRVLMASSGAAVGTFVALEVAIPAFAESEGAGAAVAGVLLALTALASMIGGLWYGSRPWSRPVHERHLALTCAFALLTAPIALANGLATMAGAMLLCGLAVAPLISCVYSLIAELAPAGTTTEAFSWLNLGFVAGGAAGAALAGGAVELLGARAGLLVSVAMAALCAALALAGRGTLAPAAVGSTPAPAG